MKEEQDVIVVQYATHEYKAVLQLREAVLRQPLGLSLQDEDLRGEAAEVILALFDGPKATACILLKPLDASIGKLRQMAVAADRQGRGYGQLLIRAVEDKARTMGLDRLTLHARETAVPFYRKLGYTVAGDRFEEVGIPHFKMEKDLAA